MEKCHAVQHGGRAEGSEACSTLLSHTHGSQNDQHIFNHFILVLFTEREEFLLDCQLERADDGPVLQLFYVLLGLVKWCVLLHCGRRTFYKLHKVMAVHLVHDAEHASAVVADAFQILAFTRERLGCREEKINISAAVFL